jgi:FkbM family methyltransferase
MFSLDYLLYSSYALLKYPEAISSIFLGKSLSSTLYNQRIKRWMEIRTRFENNPARLYDLKIFLNPNDMSGISSSIATLGWFKLAQTEVLKKLVKPQMTFVDIGANIGYFSLLASKLVGPNGLVLAYEPEVLNYSLLVKSVVINGLSNVRPIQEGVFNHGGVEKMFLASTGDPGAHSLTQSHERGIIEIRTTTLDQLYASPLNRNIDFIKIHVGAEPQILQGSKKVLELCKPTIMMTFARKIWESYMDILKELFSKYSVYTIVESPRLIKRVEMRKLLEFRYTELVLIPK